MNWFNAQVQLDLAAARLTDELADALLESLGDFHASLSTADGLITTRMSLMASDVAQAARLSSALLEQSAATAGVPSTVVAVTVMTEREFAAREGWPTDPGTTPGGDDLLVTPAPETIPLKETAEALGVTRQAVMKWMKLPVEHADHLRGQRDADGRWHILAQDVRRAVQRRTAQLSTAGDTELQTATPQRVSDSTAPKALRKSKSKAPSQGATAKGTVTTGRASTAEKTSTGDAGSAGKVSTGQAAGPGRSSRPSSNRDTNPNVGQTTITTRTATTQSRGPEGEKA